MLSLSKKTDYALIALAYLAQRPGGTASAREIADAASLPLPLLMNILKELHHHAIVKSSRGSRGGYRLAIDPAAVSLHDMIVALEGPIRMIECVPADDSCHHDASAADDSNFDPASGANGVAAADITVDAETTDNACRVSGRCAVQAPLQALHHRLLRFLHDVKLADIILPGRRIDVPRERLARSRNHA